MQNENLELNRLKINIKNLKQALLSGLFSGGLVDMFVGGQHYRIKGANTRLERGDVVINMKCLLQLVDGKWKPARSQSFTTRVNPNANVVVFHDDKGKLILVAMEHKGEAQEPVRFVLYRRGTDVDNPALQITGWADGPNPIIGDKKKKPTMH